MLASVMLGTASLASASTALATPTVTHAGSGNINVAFTADGVATSYKVLSSPSGLSCTVASATAPTGSQNCTVTGLTNGTSYTFTVTPSGGTPTATTSTISAASAAIVPGIEISTPTLTTAGATSLGVAFTADGVASIYTVNAYAHGTTTPVVASCTVSNTTTPPTGAQFCYVTGLSASTSYDVTVTPSGNNTSSFVSASATLSTGAPMTAPIISAVGSGSAKVSFTGDGVATTYNVVSTPGSFVCSVTSTTTPPSGPQSCVVTGLTNATGYTFVVTPSGGSTTATASPASSSFTPSAAVAAPTVANAGAGAVKVTFTADGHSTLYTVTSNPGSLTCTVANTTSPPTGTQNCTVTGLTGGTSYTFTVTSSGYYNPAPVSNASTAIVTLSPIAVQAPTAAGSGAVQVNFTSDGVATTYLVNAFAGGSTTASAQTCTVTNTSAITAGAQHCIVTGLTNGVSYTFTVTPSGNGTTSTVSANTTAITPGAALATPTVSTNGANAVLVSFIADGVASTYVVTSMPGSLTCTVADTTTPLTGVQSCTVKGLTNGQTYTFVVTPSGNNTASTVSAASAPITATTALNKPTVANAGTGAIKVTFAADGTATLYTVTSTLGSLTCVVGNSTTPPTGSQSCTVTGLTNGTAYTFTVTPSGNSTISTVSAASDAIVAGVNFLAAPTVQYAASTATVGAALVSFNADGTASTYTVQAYVNGVSQAGRTCTVINSTVPPTGAQSCTVNGLTIGTQYTFNVTPSGNGTTSLVSAQSAGYVAAASVAPSAPATATAVGGKGSIVVTWTAPTNTGGSAVTGYSVTATAGAATLSCGTVAATATTCTLTGLKAATAYAISVVAMNANGSGPAATSTATTTGAATGGANLHTTGAHGFAVAGRTVVITITGGGFYGQPKLTSNAFGARAWVIKDNGKMLTVRVMTTSVRARGWHTFTIRLANGKMAKVNYLTK
ncbi:MAG: beta strand repeat-containing protein [Acidimicrobiales bacterium]